MASAGVHDIFKLVGTTLEGRFTVERVVAEGGFGVVYRAQQEALQRPVALKVLKTPPRFDEDAKKQFLESFAAEARTIARIAHPNIVHVHDFGVSAMPSAERAAWMVLEWLTGVTLDEDLEGRRGHGGRDPTSTLELIKPALAALAVVHAAGVAHRDLKPANIMLVPAATRPIPKLLDFGIAKIMHTDEAPGSGNTQTRSNQVAFSPGYASPEQISQGRSGPWTDVHAMGLILTELLTDRAALEGTEAALIFQQIVDRVRPTPAKFGVRVGPWEAVLCRALAVSAGERYRDASELLSALERTVTEASLAYARCPRDGASPTGVTSVTPNTLEVMSTVNAPFGESAPKPAARPHVTTGSPSAKSEPPRIRTKGAGPAVYVAAGFLVIAIAGVLGLRGATSSSPGAGAAIVEYAPAVSASLTQPSASASSVASASVSDEPASAPPAASVSAAASASPPGAASPVLASRRPPAPTPHGSARIPPAGASGAQARPPAPGKIVVE